MGEVLRKMGREVGVLGSGNRVRNLTTGLGVHGYIRSRGRHFVECSLVVLLPADPYGVG